MHVLTPLEYIIFDVDSLLLLGRNPLVVVGSQHHDKKLTWSHISCAGACCASCLQANSAIACLTEALLGTVVTQLQHACLASSMTAQSRADHLTLQRDSCQHSDSRMPDWAEKVITWDEAREYIEGGTVESLGKLRRSEEQLKTYRSFMGKVRCSVNVIQHDIKTHLVMLSPGPSNCCCR
jgi:hypothetical protein